jgi:hypothetical protein
MEKSDIKPVTSSTGRRQFSEENAKTVKTFTPRTAQALTHRRSEATPCLWPATLGRQRFDAQRPFPSITIAMW